MGQPIRRRTVVAAMAAAAGGSALGMPISAGMRAVPWRALERDLDGRLIRPGDDGFPMAYRLFDPRYDRRRPMAVVRAAHADDVATAVDFARRHGIRMRARSGGHSYVGASTVDGGLVVSLAGLDHVRMDGDRVTVGAGAQLIDVHAALDRRGHRTIPTGTCPSVGTGGLTLGGGVGPESRAYGLTCDAVRAMRLVTAQGKVLTVDRQHHPDLFWALRGGGGGNVGIVTSFTMRTHAAHRTGFGFLSWPASVAPAVIRGWQRRIKRSPRSAWSIVHVDAVSSGASIRILVTSLTGDAHDEAAALERAIGHPPSSASFTSRPHLAGVRLLAGCSDDTVGECHTVPGGTLPRQSFVAGSDVIGGRIGPRVSRALVRVVAERGRAGGHGSLLLDALGGAVADVNPGATAFRWRGRSAATAQWYVGLGDSSSTAARKSARRWIARGHRAFGDTSVGAYVNYLEPGRRSSDYYGGNLARMRRIRSRRDPTGLFDSPWSVPRR